MGLDKLGFKTKSLPIIPYCLLELALFLQDNAEIVVCQGIVRSTAQSLLIAGDRPVDLALCLQDDAEIGVDLGQIRPQAQGLPEGRSRLLQVATILQGIPEVAERFDKIGFET